MPSRYRNRRRRQGRRGPRRVLYNNPMSRKRLYGLETHRFNRNARQYEVSLTSDPQSTWTQEALTFQLSDVINVSDFINIFDQFTINSVELTIRWSPNDAIYASNNNMAATGAYNPVLYYVSDHDDNDPIPSITDMLEIQKHKSVRLMPGKPVIINVKPAVQAQAYQTALTTAYGPKWNMKLNMDDNDTPHYGLKIGVSKQSNNFGALTIDTKYFFTCYGVQ